MSRSDSHPAATELCDGWCKVESPFPRPGHQDSPPGCALLGRQASPTIAPELHAAALGGREGRLGAGRHEPGLEP